MKNKPLVVEYAFQNIVDNNFEMTIIQAIQAVLNKDISEAEYIADKNLSFLWNLFVKRIENHNSTGMNPYFIITDNTTYRFEDYCKITERDGITEKKKKLKLKKRNRILKYINSLNWRHYEALGMIALKLLGARPSKIHLTDPGNEEGVDFLGIVPAFGKYHIIPNNSKNIRVIGQSKKWTKPAPKERISLLNDSIENFKRRRLDYINKFPSWIFTNNGNYFGLLFSHSGYQSGAIDFAKDYGIILADSYDLTEIISLSYPINIDSTQIISQINKEILSVIN